MLRSPTAGSLLTYALSGAGFAGANLLLARWLPESEYALFTLVLALQNLGSPLATAGLDGVALRRPLVFRSRLLGQVLLAASLVGLALSLVGVVAYDLSPALAALVFVTCLAGGAMVLAGAEFQRQHRFARSLALVQSPNLVLVLAALMVPVAGARVAWLPLLIATAGFVVAAGWGWWVLLREETAAVDSGVLPWGEALSLAGTNSSGLLLAQLDRLIIPHVLPLSYLALYGVLSAVVGSFFRVLQRGVGYALLPRLTRAADVAARRRLVRREAWQVGGFVLAGSALFWAVPPAVQHYLLADKYELGNALIAATVVAGLAKILNAFSRATVTALADQRELSLVNLTGWVSVGVSVIAALLGARWGLAGVIYGVGLGWLLRALTALAITVRHLRV
jgi:O-antigen/teichoic acid export membrane protein